MARRLLHSVLTMTAAHTGIIQERAVLTARIMAGASAQWHGTRTADIIRTATRYAANVGGSWRWRTASGIDDGQHTPMATAAHTTRYDLQAGMVADIIQTTGGIIQY